MKKTLITLMALVGVASGATEVLTLNTPSGGSLESSNKGISWTEDYSSLTSWSLSFELLDAALTTKDYVIPGITQITVTPDGGDPYNRDATNSDMHTSVTNIFGTRTNGGGAGVLLSIAKDGALVLYTYKAGTNTYVQKTDAGWVTAGNLTAITMSFVADVDAQGNVKSGTFTLSSGANTASYVINDELGYTSLTNTPDKDGSRLWTNGGAEKFYNVSVSKLDNNLVPEPATATLSLLALAGLAARRRRK